MVYGFRCIYNIIIGQVDVMVCEFGVFKGHLDNFQFLIGDSNRMKSFLAKVQWYVAFPKGGEEIDEGVGEKFVDSVHEWEGSIVVEKCLLSYL